MKERINWWWFFLCVGIVLPALQSFFLPDSTPVILFPFLKDIFINGLYPFLATAASIFILFLIVLCFKSITKYVQNVKKYNLIYLISGSVFMLFYVNQFVGLFTNSPAPRRYYKFTDENFNSETFYLSIVMFLELGFFMTFFLINFSRRPK